MGSFAGGINAASGLFYQYLFTIETFLKLVEDGAPGDSEVRIEDGGELNIADPDIVDFSVHYSDGRIRSLHQVKSAATPVDTTISANDALEVLIRLVSSVDCPEYVLTTNARPGREVDRLNTALQESNDKDDPDGDVLLVELRAIASASTVCTAAVSSLNPQLLTRLRRARVHATGESSTVIRHRITERLAVWRREHRLPLGERAARLLENSLITNVFSRAAGTVSNPDDPHHSCRRVTLSKFEELLAEPSAVLADAAAIAEYGNGIHSVPSGEGVARPVLYGQIAHRFDNVRTRNIQRCALTGRSGIGKSRLAAMYCHQEHEAYDRVCWIDAESESSIIASITAQAPSIGVALPQKLAPENVATAFRESIRRFTGRWLIVFDDAPHARLLESWMPHAGTAHVLVTSTNSVDWTAYQPIPVPPMGEPQAIQLLRSRLTDDSPGSDPERASLDSALSRLATELECWPLALQIAAAHFGTTSSLVRGAATYLSQIAGYIIDDDSLDRDGYPRTLQVAINICLDRLYATSRTEQEPGLGRDMLVASSLLASHAIPEVLLYAIATVHPNVLVGLAGAHPMEAQRDLPLVDRGVRRIRSESLVERSTQRSGEATPWELRGHVDVNEIVQRIVRQRIAVGSVLNECAAHVSKWLDHFMTDKDFSSAIALQPHALSILKLAKDTPADSETDLRHCALLAGNQSILLDLQGKSAVAKDWLVFELTLLQRLPTPHLRLIAKTAQQIAQSLVHLGSSGEEIEHYTTMSVNALERAVDDGDLDWGGETVRQNLLEFVRSLSRKAQHQGHVASSITELQHRLDRLHASFPRHAVHRHQAASKAVEADLDNGRYDSALASARTLLGNLAPEDHLNRLSTRASEIDALAMLDKIDELQTRVEEFAADHARHPVVVSGLASSLINAAASLQIQELNQPGDLQKRSALTQLLRASRDLLVSDSDRYKHALLSACEASHRDDANGVRTMLEIAHSVKPTVLPNTNLSNFLMEWITQWLEYWSECAAKSAAARVVPCQVYIRPRPADDGTQSITLYLVVPGLKAELSRAAHTPGRTPAYRGMWRPGMLGHGRALELREAIFDRPVACILIGDHPDNPDDPPTDPLDWLDNDASNIAYEVFLGSSMSSNENVAVAI